MTAGGSVIINGSAGAVKGVPGATVYAASKAALRSFARTWTAELAGRGIRVNLLSAGPIDTAAYDGTPAEVRAGLTAMIPAGRLGRPEEIATAVLFLACDDSAFVYAPGWPSTAVSPRSDGQPVTYPYWAGATSPGGDVGPAPSPAKEIRKEIPCVMRFPGCP